MPPPPLSFSSLFPLSVLLSCPTFLTFFVRGDASDDRTRMNGEKGGERILSDTYCFSKYTGSSLLSHFGYLPSLVSFVFLGVRKPSQSCAFCCPGLSCEMTKDVFQLLSPLMVWSTECLGSVSPGADRSLPGREVNCCRC